MSTPATLRIEGMHCDGCVRRVRAALSSVDGVQVKDVKVGSADIEIDPAKVQTGDTIHALEDIGFTAQVS